MKLNDRIEQFNSAQQELRADGMRLQQEREAFEAAKRESVSAVETEDQSDAESVDVEIESDGQIIVKPEEGGIALAESDDDESDEGDE